MKAGECQFQVFYRAPGEKDFAAEWQDSIEACEAAVARLEGIGWEAHYAFVPEESRS